MGLKAIVPARLKRCLRLLITDLEDLISLRSFRFVRCRPYRIAEGRGFESCLTITQPINKSRWAEPKIHNIELAVRGFLDCAIPTPWIFTRISPDTLP
ncbi:MAG: hypothetical protein MUP70_09705, partial [Candidatus Aminicenantes bacterium]|nr:hypothetical protein [Candidatus Aminicenantes bacterium]